MVRLQIKGRPTGQLLGLICPTGALIAIDIDAPDITRRRRKSGCSGNLAESRPGQGEFEDGALVDIGAVIHRSVIHDGVVHAMLRPGVQIRPFDGISVGILEFVVGNPDVVDRIEAEAAPEVIAELRQTFPDFVRACDQGALVPEEFRSYGPVVRFQNSLLKGFATVIGEIQARQCK